MPQEEQVTGPVDDRPLADVRVLDLTRLLPGGYATLLMADMGADVVKVEEPGSGDYIRWMPPLAGDASAAHLALNRNKRSITLNLKTPQGPELLTRLVQRFDVVIESFRPGVMERLGVGWPQLAKANERLVYCAITGYGQTGPRAREAGHDVNYMGYAGALGLNGSPSGPPVIPPLQVGDLGGGGMAAVIAILAALRQRDRTGRGSMCDVSMTDGIVSWLGVHIAQMAASGQLPRRGLMTLSGAHPCYRVYPAADGWMAVGALEPQFWRELCRVLERPDLEGDAFAPPPRRDVVIAALEQIFSTRTRADWMEVFAGRDTCVSPIQDLQEMLDDPQLLARGMVVPGEGGLPQIGHPLGAGGPAGSFTVAPGLGQHTGEVLAEIGIEASDLEELERGSVV